MGYSTNPPAQWINASVQPVLQQCTGPSTSWVPGMSPGDVAALAVRLSRLAGEIEVARAGLAGATTLDWRSKAAEAFRQEAGLRAADLSTGASDARVASDYVAAYARALEALDAKLPGMLGG